MHADLNSAMTPSSLMARRPDRMAGAQHTPLEEEERIGGGGAPPPTEYRAAPKSRRAEDDGGPSC